jgi:hypothetical protein
MLSLVASSIFSFAGGVLASYLVMRIWHTRSAKQDATQGLNEELQRTMAGLHAILVAARRESKRLEVAAGQTTSCPSARPGETLGTMEELADPRMMATANALAEVADRMPASPDETWSELFQQNDKAVNVTRLVEQGHSTAEIGRRMHLPIGEVEFLLNLRSR